ncbi:MFS transporter [Streptomyces xiamenensis]|uniref:MFS transporter n=1 Tax=Streptomyces xiamenensis TaxID=408015 RepID=UPI003D74C861
MTESSTSTTGRLSDKPLGVYYAGYTASMTADQVWLTTLGWSAAQLGEPLLTGAVLGAGTLPRAALMLLGGVLVDRVGIRLLALGTQAARVLGMLAAAVLAMSFPDEWVPLFIVALVFGAISALNIPALAAAPALLAAPARLPRITAILQTAQRVATVIGAPVGGLLLATGGPVSATIACALLFALALAGFQRTRLPNRPATAAEERHRATDGFRYILSEPILRALLVTIACLNITIIGSFNVGLPLLVTDQGWPASAYGLIEGCFGLGAVLGAVAVVVTRTPLRPARAALLYAATQIPLLASLAYLERPAAVAITAAGAGLTLGPAGALLVGLVQALTDRSYIGRVVSIVNFVSVGLTPIFYLAFSAVAGSTGIRTAFLATGAFQAAIVVCGLCNRTLRTATLPPTADHARIKKSQESIGNT